MPTHFLYFWKIWDRGVDIGVGVITSAIIAAIGLLTWRFKLTLDLHAEKAKRRLQFEMEDTRAEHARHRAAKDAERALTEKHERLKQEIESLAVACAGAKDLATVRKYWAELQGFLRYNDLLIIPENRILDDDDTLQNVSISVKTDDIASHVAGLMRQAKIPRPGR